MTGMRLIKKEKCCLVNGSGVNLVEYTPSPLPKEDIFLFIGSLLRNKGICEYMEAASIIKEKYPEVKCLIVGPIDQRISTIKESDLKRYLEDGSIRYLGFMPDVRPYLDQCRYFVLPSYREGTPRSVLEAMAKGRPIITTDTPGCRETVIDGENGFLIPIRDNKSLVNKMLWMIEHPEDVERMAQKSLFLVRDKYDVNKINQFMLKEMNLTA
jgi:glycosyltransferase involved in cell wall biosynthesis